MGRVPDEAMHMSPPLWILTIIPLQNWSLSMRETHKFIFYIWYWRIVVVIIFYFNSNPKYFYLGFCYEGRYKQYKYKRDN